MSPITPQQQTNRQREAHPMVPTCTRPQPTTEVADPNKMLIIEWRDMGYDKASL